MYCPNCGGEFAGPVDGRCPHCGHDVGFQTGPPAPPGADLPGAPEGGEGGGRPPFEDPSVGFFDGVVATIRGVFADPAGFFRTMPDTSDIGRAFLFSLLLNATGAFFKAVWGLTINSVFAPGAADLENLRRQLEQSGMPDRLVDFYMQMLQQMQGPAGAVTGFVTSVVLGVVALFLVAGIVHLLLMLYGGANRRFGATFRVAAYCSAFSLLLIVPVCGALIAIVWQIVVFIIGLAQAQRTSAWRAAFAALTFPVLCCVCCCAGTIMIAVAASGSH